MLDHAQRRVQVASGQAQKLEVLWVDLQQFPTTLH